MQRTWWPEAGTIIVTGPYSNWSYSPETLNSGQNQQFFVLCYLEIWRLTLKTKRAPLQCCFKLCASFHSHQWIQTRVTVRKRPIWVKIDVFLSCVILKFDRWPWKTKGHLFYATSSFPHHFVTSGEFKLELQSRNAQFGSKSTIFLAVWPWNFEVWPWKTIGHLSKATSSSVHHFIIICEFKLELRSGKS